MTPGKKGMNKTQNKLMVETVSGHYMILKVTAVPFHVPHPKLEPGPAPAVKNSRPNTSAASFFLNVKLRSQVENKVLAKQEGGFVDSEWFQHVPMLAFFIFFPASMTTWQAAISEATQGRTRSGSTRISSFSLAQKLLNPAICNSTRFRFASSSRVPVNNDLSPSTWAQHVEQSSPEASIHAAGAVNMQSGQKKCRCR